MNYSIQYNSETGIIADIIHLLTIQLAPPSMWTPVYTLVDTYASDLSYIDDFKKEFDVRYSKLLLFSYKNSTQRATYLGSMFSRLLQENYLNFSFQTFISYFQNSEQVQHDLLTYYLGEQDYSSINLEPLIRKNSKLPDKIKILLFGFLQDPSTYLRHLTSQMQIFYSLLYPKHDTYAKDFSFTEDMFNSIIDTWCSDPAIMKKTLSNTTIFYSISLAVPNYLLRYFSPSLSWLIFSPKSLLKLKPSKKPISSQSLVSLAHTLSDTSRVTILQLLHSNGYLSLKDLLVPLGCSRSTLQHHLAILEDANLIYSEQYDSEKRYYCNHNGLETAVNTFSKLTKGDFLQ